MVVVPRLKNVGGNLVVRNDADTENADIELKLIKITGGDPEADKILTSDTDGLASWQTNAAIELANAAQTTADEAKADAAAAQATADAAQTAASAAQATADAAIIDAAATSAAAAAAAASAATGIAAAAVANALAVAAGIDAANAQTRADDAYTLASVALDVAQKSYPVTIRVHGDELIYTSGTPTNAISSTSAYNWVEFTSANGATGHTSLILRAGTWTFKFLTNTGTANGRCTITIGAVVLADPEELYSSPAVNNKIITYAGVTIPASDTYTLQFLTNGKNGASSGFAVVVNKFWGYRTGA